MNQHQPRMPARNIYASDLRIDGLDFGGVTERHMNKLGGTQLMNLLS